jgi:tetratricopeptide (TPR) repeat protein
VAPVAARPRELTNIATPLPTGKLALPTGVTAILDDDASASARFEQGTLDIALARGRIELHVPPREMGQAVLLTAARFRFTVVGTAFELSLGPRKVDLAVSEGLVAVSRDADHLATVAPGETWTGSVPAPLPQSAHPAPRIVRRAAPSDCSQFSVEQGKERVACYRELATKGGPEGERAQHALARYLRDDVVDLTAALNAFEAQRSRFPHGGLKADADRAIIGLLPRLGRHAEALVETQSFLDARPDAEDRAEIRLLRGDIYRAIFRDLMSAEREYDEGAGAQGRTGDDSRFLRALCLEALGRMDEARVAYEEYLAQAGTAHTREAQRRMERLPQ